LLLQDLNTGIAFHTTRGRPAQQNCPRARRFLANAVNNVATFRIGGSEIPQEIMLLFDSM
jgi:hypothetical protein